MGCLKLRYKQGEGLEKSTVHFMNEARRKSVPEKKCIDYYPFGLAFNSYQRPGTVENKYKYNGFEDQPELDWNVYDYQARYYDPALGRFLNVDPAADISRRNGVYNYAYNNPLRYIDPDGMVASDTTGTGSNQPPPDDSNTDKNENQSQYDQWLQENGLEDNGDNFADFVAIQSGKQSDGEGDGESSEATVVPITYYTPMTLTLPNWLTNTGTVVLRSTASILSLVFLTGDTAQKELTPLGPPIVLSKQDKLLSPGEIDKLKDAGYDPHELKGGKSTGQTDLYKTPNGDIVVKGKGGKGPGEPTGININDIQ